MKKDRLAWSSNKTVVYFRQSKGRFYEEERLCCPKRVVCTVIVMWLIRKSIYLEKN